MSRRIRQLYEVFDNASKYLAQKDIELDKHRINALLTCLYSPGPSIQYIFDFSVRRFEYVSAGAINIFGENANSYEVADLLNRVHPDDIVHFKKCKEITRHFLFSFIPKEESHKFKISCQIRIKDADDNYRLFLHQAIVFTIAKNLRMASTFANNSDISDSPTESNYGVSFINITGGKSYYNVTEIEDLYKYQNIEGTISDRELEILRHLAKGLSSKEIAEDLFISYETVRTHRNNILKKSNFKTLTQTIVHLVRQGLL